RTGMKLEAFLKRKACIGDAQSARKKVAYVTAGNVQQAKEIALARPENRAFIIDGIPRRAS
ncbi:hypothetical protein, partial [Xylella fastidiosa]|uniref:hypothetical protein n=1 Tax=Xylella fastidiosa TaxID=2371 RepID=UPI0019D6A24A